MFDFGLHMLHYWYQNFDVEIYRGCIKSVAVIKYSSIDRKKTTNLERICSRFESYRVLWKLYYEKQQCSDILQWKYY